MKTYLRILHNEYYDSVTLMSLTASLKKQYPGDEIILLMGTPMNVTLMLDSGFKDPRLEKLTPNDCVIGIKTNTQEEGILDTFIQALKSNKTATNSVDNQPLAFPSLASASQALKANVAVISVPGAYAAYEAQQALLQGLNVMLFSDNVSVEDEVQLKKTAIEKNLLMMGPDCGTAILNGVGLAFANTVRQGPIGIIAASGTGLQEVTVLIDRFGGGISHAIGTGGRDLSEKVGGLMMLYGIDVLNADEQTKVITLISKPPAANVYQKILEKLKTVKKPVIIGFIDGEKPENSPYEHAATLAETAFLSLKAMKINPPVFEHLTSNQDMDATANKKQGKFIRGLYCGGTLCAEGLSLARKKLTDVYSNVSKKPQEQLKDVFSSQGHTFVDLGDDVFTNGRPHPMIEPTIRLERILQEAKDSQVGVLLLDFELGFGSHDDPTGTHLDALKSFQQTRPDVVIIAYVCGTNGDQQQLAAQENKLKQIGVRLASSHAQAVRYAIAVIQGGQSL
jgi:succinyl-CoA synthetase alpha subunit